LTPGGWTFAPLPSLQSAQTPWLAVMTPFMLKSPSQFRSDPPPALSSAKWARDFNEIKAYGSVNSTVRAPEQTAIAQFWNANADTKGIWFSLYTPQKGERSAEILLPEDRRRVVAEIASLRDRLPKLRDMRKGVLEGYLTPPADPDACIFAQTTACLSSDLEKRITPCQFGGDPDCSQCGCIASAGLVGFLFDIEPGGT
jgi:hypothetical protein